MAIRLTTDEERALKLLTRAHQVSAQRLTISGSGALELRYASFVDAPVGDTMSGERGAATVGGLCSLVGLAVAQGFQGEAERLLDVAGKPVHVHVMWDRTEARVSLTVEMRAPSTADPTVPAPPPPAEHIEPSPVTTSTRVAASRWI